MRFGAFTRQTRLFSKNLPASLQRPMAVLQKGKQFLKSRLENLNANPDRMPTTTSTVSTLHSVRTSDTFDRVQSGVRTDAGRKVVTDVQNLIAHTERLIENKNVPDELREAVAHLHRGQELMDKEALKASGASGDVTQTLKTSVSQFIDIVKLLVTQSEFREAAMSLLQVLFKILGFNFNMDLSLPSGSTFHEGRDNLHHVTQNFMHGESTLRDTLHGYVDALADTTEHIVPTPLQEKAVTAASGHARRISAGDVSAYQASREAARGALQSAREKKNTFEIPEEHRQEAVETLRSALRTIRSKEEYSRAVENLLNQFDQLVQHGSVYKSTVVGKGKRAVTSDAQSEFMSAWEVCKRLLEKFANGMSLGTVIEAIQEFAREIANNETLFNLFQDWKRFLLSSLKEPEFINQDTYLNDAGILARTTKDTLKQDHRNSAQTMLDRLSDFFGGFSADPDNRQVADDLKTLLSDIFYDESGNLVIKTDLVHDLGAIFPILGDSLANVPLPPLEYENDQWYIKVENVVLHCTGILPKYMNFNTGATIDMDQKAVNGNVTLDISRIQVSLQNAKFTYRKKTGFFKIEDTGMIDAHIYNRGLYARINLVPYWRNGVKGFDVDEATAAVDQLDLRIHDTKNHHLLYKLARGPAKRMARKQINSYLSTHLRDAVNSWSGIGTGGGSDVTV